MKKLVTNYTFNAVAKTIVSPDFTLLEGVLLITNVTDNIIIYNFAGSGKGGSLAGTTLTLDYDTTLMADTDDLQVFVDVPTVGEYSLYASEYGATYNYIAKEDASGAWFIQRETISSGVREYVAGASAVGTAWTNRASQVYGLYSAAF